MKLKTALIILTILILTLTLILIKIPSKIVDQDLHTYTKAICDDSNYCEDYVIECSGKETKSITPTGFSIQMEHDWEDPRENPEEFCN